MSCNLQTQCGKDANPLTQDFRCDVSCLAFEGLLGSGITRTLLDRWSASPKFLFPWKPGYDAWRFNQNKRFNVFPWIIFFAETDTDVSWMVRLAQRYRLPISLRSGGHCYERYSICGYVVIDQTRRTGMEVRGTTVVLEAGVTTGLLVRRLAKRGLAITAGTCPNVGLTGLALGGGLGFLMRHYGLTCDSLVSLNMVDADGRLVEASAEVNPDLYWAHRGGGGGNFGVVTRLVFEARPVSDVIMFEVEWDFDDAVPAYDAWQRFAVTTIPEITANFFMELSGDRSRRPLGCCPVVSSKRRRDGKKGTSRSDRLSAKMVGMYSGRKYGTPGELERFLEEHFLLPRDATPTGFRVWKTPYVKASEFLAGTVRFGPFFKSKCHIFTEPMPRAGLERQKGWLADAARKLPEDVFVQFVSDALGGNIASMEPDETAFPHRYGYAFSVQYVTNWTREENADVVLPWISGVYESMRPFASGKSYVNYIDRDLEHWPWAYYSLNWPRLVKIKRRWDPKNLFRFRQSIGFPLSA